MVKGSQLIIYYCSSVQLSTLTTIIMIQSFLQDSFFHILYIDLDEKEKIVFVFVKSIFVNTICKLYNIIVIVYCVYCNLNILCIMHGVS